jgi:alkanesulfonate monooxygenase
MSLTFHWFLPTSGDSRDIVGGGRGVAPERGPKLRPASLAYLTQVAQAAEHLGFEGVLTPTGTWCEDAWLTTAMLVAATRRLRFLVAFRPGLISPTLAAQMASTYQRYSNGRLLLNVVTGGEDREQAAFGDFLAKDDRYARADEFLTVVERLWESQTVTFEGSFERVVDATLARVPEPRPKVYFGGSSGPAGRVAARHADVYLTWGEPPDQVAEKVSWVRGLAAEEGRTLAFGLRAHVISRDVAEDAWREADRQVQALDPARIAAAQSVLANAQSVGQQRMVALHNGSTANLEIAPNLWAGVGLVRSGAGTALVGSHEEIADRLAEYAQLGVSEFILSGHPHLEEAYWFAEGVLPILERRGLWGRPDPESLP